VPNNWSLIRVTNCPCFSFSFFNHSFYSSICMSPRTNARLRTHDISSINELEIARDPIKAAYQMNRSFFNSWMYVKFSMGTFHAMKEIRTVEEKKRKVTWQSRKKQRRSTVDSKRSSKHRPSKTITSVCSKEKLFEIITSVRRERAQHERHREREKI
jgi:hypothetical protein